MEEIWFIFSPQLLRLPSCLPVDTLIGSGHGFFIRDLKIFPPVTIPFSGLQYLIFLSNVINHGVDYQRADYIDLLN